MSWTNMSGLSVTKIECTTLILHHFECDRWSHAKLAYTSTVGDELEPSSRIRCLKPEIFLFSSVWPNRPDVFGQNGHRKRIFSKALSTVKIFDNTGFSFTFARTKTDVFEYDDVMNHLITA